MVTVQTIENIKKGSKITYFNGIYAMILGVLYIILFKLILIINFSNIAIVWDVFARYNSALYFLFVKLIIFKGLLIFAMGVAITYLSNYIIKKKDKAAWVVLFILGIIFWTSLLVLEILDRNIYTASAVGIGWIIFLIGMLIPMGYYMQKGYEDY